MSLPLLTLILNHKLAFGYESFTHVDGLRAHDDKLYGDEGANWYAQGILYEWFGSNRVLPSRFRLSPIGDLLYFGQLFDKGPRDCLESYQTVYKLRLGFWASKFYCRSSMDYAPLVRVTSATYSLPWD